MQAKIILLFVLISTIYKSQNYILIDEEYDTPVTFADILSIDGDFLTTTDHNGKFSLKEYQPTVKVLGTYFQDQEIQLPEKSGNVYINTYKFLRTVEVSSDDKEVRQFIRNIMRHQKDNHPDNLDSYSFVAYKKAKIDTNPDSIRLDWEISKEDTQRVAMRSFIQNSVLFMIEEARNYKHSKKYGDKVEIIAHKVTGLKQPIYELMATQTFDPYLEGDKFQFFLSNYANPVSQLGLQEYRYSFDDTIAVEGVQRVKIKFSPKNLANAGKPLMGYIIADLDTYGLVEFYGEMPKDRYASIEMNWKKRSGYYFPENQDFYFDLQDIVMVTQEKETEEYRQRQDSLDSMTDKERKNYYKERRKERKDLTEEEREELKEKNAENTNELPVWFERRFIYDDFQIPSDIEKSEFNGYEFEISPTLQKDTDELLLKYRDTLTFRELNSYTKLDSIFDEENINKYLKLGHIITRRSFPIGNKLELDLQRIIDYNEYEGFRPQLKLFTNENFIRNLRLEGLIAYGFKDKKEKYELSAYYRIFPKSSGNLFASMGSNAYAIGLFEPQFLYFNKPIEEITSHLYNDFFFISERYAIGYQQDWFKNVSVRVTLESTNDRAGKNYSFNFEDPDRWYHFNNLHLGAIWKPFDQYMTTPYGRETVQKRSTTIGLHFMKSFKNNKTDFGFENIEMYVAQDINLFIGKTELYAKGGYIWGNAPIFYNFSANGTAKSGESVWDRFSVSGYRQMETIQAGEFFMNQYFNFMVYQNLPNFRLLGSNIKPNLNYKFLWGDQTNASDHILIEPKAPIYGYNELGLELKDIFKFLGLGVGGYYRLGEYAKGDFQDDFFFKLNFNFDF